MNSKRIALLAIGAFSFCASCNKNVSEDAKYIDEINAIVKKNADNIVTCSDAVNAVLLEDKDIQSYKFMDDNKLAFDVDSKCFCLFNTKKEVVRAPSGYKLNENPYHFFVLTDNYDSSAEYSQYLTRDFVGSDLLIATTGLDMGENKNVKNITYFNNSGVAKDVILNVSCDYLNISAPLDNIVHYGSANNVFVPANYTGAFREYAECSYIQISGGTFYLEDSSYADIVEVPSGCAPTIYQSENSNVLARFNANIRAESNIRCKEIDNSEITITELQDLLNDTSYNFYRLTTEARDIVLHDGYLEFNRNLFFDLNGRSITFMHGKDVEIQKQLEPTPEDPKTHETYKTGILVTGKYNEGKSERDVTAFLLDTQSTLYQRSGINLLDCSILVKGNDDENTAVNFYVNSGKIHDVRGSDGITSPVSSPAILLVGNILQDNKDRKPKYCNFYMYGGYIKTEKGVNWGKVSHKCIQPRGLGCTLNMVYGDLESFHFAISGQGFASNSFLDVDKYGNTTINIIGGNIVGGTEDTSYPVLFFPQSGVVNITGGKITGPSCIDAKAGTINIYGGEFNATKNPYNEKAEASEDGGACDGSVIFMESAKCYHGALLDPLKINVEYSTMYSKTGHIVKASGYKRKTEKDYAEVSINFKDGEFSYKKDNPIICEEKIKDVFSSSINGGTWSKHE